jgi:hypothetical protein
MTHKVKMTRTIEVELEIDSSMMDGPGEPPVTLEEARDAAVEVVEHEVFISFDQLELAGGAKVTDSGWKVVE